MDYIEYCAKNSEDFRANYLRFFEIFHTPLKPYWSNLTRFDIVGFDDNFIKSGNGNFGAEVLARYGQEAVDLVKLLC